MSTKDKQIVFLESGKRWVFAGAIDWPGWCRRGKDEALALKALIEAGSRYARVLAETVLDFNPVGGVGDFKVVERVAGNSTTDFGAPDADLKQDDKPVSSDELERFSVILNACWVDFDRTVEAAEGKDLLKGPRGGGRNVSKLIDHVIGSDASYLGRIGWKAPKTDGWDPQVGLAVMRKAMLEGLQASAHGELPLQGPRGGLRWPARRFVRRVAWHVLDHAWEIEDRML